MFNLTNITLERGNKTLFTDATFTVSAKQKIALVGANGSGKSSLFSFLMQEITPKNGKLNVKTKAKIAALAQEIPALEISALDYVLDGDKEFRKIEHELLDAEKKDNSKQIAILHAQFAAIDGYRVKPRAQEILYGLGFNSDDYAKPVKNFSGGWRMRLNLAQILLGHPDVLLLDEPTNHLDLDAIIWLERWLQKFSGTILFISHDRDFINAIADHIIHIEHQQIKLYSGNYDSFEILRAQNLSLLEANYQKQQKQIAHLEKYINRFRYKASKAKQAQSRIKMLEKMELISKAHIDASFNFIFKKAEKFPNTLLKLKDVSCGYENNAILQNINLTISPNLRLGLLGRNGAGKSTLLKLLAGMLQPMSGELTTNQYLKIGYFAQHQIDYLDLNITPLAHLKKIDTTATSEQNLRTFLGGFAFSANEALTPITNFSGGEKARLALALIVWQRPNLLLLDEPTNHLDIDMRDALTIALQTYEGAMIIVSHDRHLLRTTVDQFILVDDKKVLPFPGDIEDYKKWLDENKKTKTEEKKAEKLQMTDKANHNEKRKTAALLKKIEKEVETLQIELKKIDENIATFYSQNNTDQGLLQKQLDLQKTLKANLLEKEILWLELLEKTE
jgi:ATP-binding cassette subfamily F protein 3